MTALHIQRYFYSPKGLSRILHAGAEATALINAADQTLGQYEGNRVALYAADSQRSIVHTTDPGTCSLRYTAYGFDRHDGRVPMVHYTGQHKDSATGHYLLGKGYRAYNPAQMRFNSPDSLSPFGLGGINAYGYCGGDPVNRHDPSGHIMLRRASFSGRPKPIKSPSLPPRRTHSFNGMNRHFIKMQSTRIPGSRMEFFARHIDGIPSNKFGDLLSYQGRNTGAWLDEFSLRNQFIKNDLTLVEGAGASVTRDLRKLVKDIVSYPPSTETDVRLRAANRLYEALSGIQQLQEKIRISVSFESRRSWLHDEYIFTVRRGE